jgi:cytochrome P450
MASTDGSQPTPAQGELTPVAELALRSITHMHADPDPYPALRELRELSGVHRIREHTFVVYRHAEAVRVLRSPHACKRDLAGRLPFIDESEGRRSFMLHQDPPDHTRLRRLVARAFTPRALASLDDRIRTLVDGLLDRVAEQGHMDLIADLALPVPCIVICEILGVPAADRHRFTEWTSDATYSLLGNAAPAELKERARRASSALNEYFTALIAERSKKLGDDMLSSMIRMSEDGDRLSSLELLHQSIGLLVAGFETTVGLIGNGMRTLLMNPEQLGRLEADPERMESAVEECLRFEPPIFAVVRVMHEVIELGTERLPAGSLVAVHAAAANRDPRVFADPERFDIERMPGEHLSFGGGSHYCLGAHLARMEARITLSTLLHRFALLKLESEQPVWGRSLFRVLESLPIRFAPRHRER